MDAVTHAFVAEALLDAPAGLLIDVGARDVNGTLRDVVPHWVRRYVGVDTRAGPNVDVIASGAALPFASGTVGCVTCCSVLEHTPEGRAIIREAHRVLATGGHFVVTTVDARWPCHSAIDGGPLRTDEYYGAIDESQLTDWLLEVDFDIYDAMLTERGDVMIVALREGPS